MDEHYTPNLGGTPDETARRDAVHVAVAPVIAGEDLPPGSRVNLLDGKAYESTSPIGIVDPFQRECVRKGERFWLLLFPGTITGLRHQWSHSAFATTPPRKESLHGK